MQIKGLHKNIYKLYSYARTQECLDVYRQKYVSQVRKWEKLKAGGLSDKLCQEFVGISRASFYRSKKMLDDLNKGIIPPSKRPQKINKPKWSEAHKQLVLKIRRENPTYGKQKIASFAIWLGQIKGFMTRFNNFPMRRYALTLQIPNGQPATFYNI